MSDAGVKSLAEGTSFLTTDNRFRLTRLCGMALEGQDPGRGHAELHGVALLRVDGHRYEGGQLVMEHLEETADTVTCRWRVGQTALRLTTVWQGDPATGVVSRRDAVTHTGTAPVVLTRCLVRVAFPQGRYECYTQGSSWCRENQGAWQPLHAGLRLNHFSGRTTEGGTPYLAMRGVGAGHGIAFHVLPKGNWTIRVAPVACFGDLAYAVVELGLADENLNRAIQPGETFALPEVLFQAVPRGEPELAAPVLHRYLLSHHFRDAKPEAPVVYNTWFDQFEILDVPRMREQLAVAKEVGCEMFVVDAGWYGAGDGDWGAQTGDWREKTSTAFCGRMREFADEVRAAGLGFGLWMEPERFGALAPVRAEHPEWFVAVGQQARIDLTQPAAWKWVRSEIGRLVETYGLAWMKIDFNFKLDIDDAGAELSDYMAAWYRMLDAVRAAYPGTFFEGCASGAMRGDMELMRHVDGHFLSDTVNPTDMLRISQGAWLRLPPGRIGRWAVIRSLQKAVPQYGRPLSDSPAIIIVPRGGVWYPAMESVWLDYALLAAMPGMMGLSGDLLGLTVEQRARVAQGVAFFKEWRRFIVGSAGHLLTPAEAIDRREGWLGFQLQSPDSDTSLVFVYRLGPAGAMPSMRLNGLRPEARYIITAGFEATGKTPVECDGATLMRDGLQGLIPGDGAWIVRAAGE